MKFITFLSIVVFSVTILINAQIPNADFENWTNSKPDGWWSDDAPPVILPITQTTDAQHGNAALKGEVILFQNTLPVTPILSAGSDSLVGGGFPVTQRYASLIGYYKFAPVQNDSMSIIVAMLKNGNVIGDGTVKPNPAGTYTQFTANINYNTSDIPDTCRIFISIVNNTGGLNNVHTGSVMYVDNLSFGNVTAVDNQTVLPNSFELFQNYPNPFNPATMIKYDLSSSGFVTLTIYDLLGEKVETLVNKTQNNGEHEVTADLSRFTSGVYFYRLNVNSDNGKQFTSIKKMILMK